MAVCSNSVRSTIELMMHRSALMEYLEFFLSNQDVSNGKPDPEIYVKAMDRLGLQPEQCLIVEDHPNGIVAAKASGAFVLEVTTTADVNLENIRAAIARFEEAATC